MWTNHGLDFLAIGDITIDAFIRLKDAKVHCNINNADCELCVRFGDKVPYDSVVIVPAVGNAANASVTAARLGLSSAFVGAVGDDSNGKLCRDTLKAEGVAVSYLRTDKNFPTNYHFVLSYEAERTILIKHQPFTYELPQGARPRWIYLSSLNEDSLSFHYEIAKFLAENPEVKLAFQPGTFQMQFGYEKLRDLYARTELFFCNKEEAQRITGNKSTDMKELLAAVRTLGPKVALITDGPNGAYASDGTERLFISMYPDPKPPVSRTGAGDAFSSTVVCALIMGKPLREALTWGPINSMSVVQQIGAQKGLLKRTELEKLLADAPATYRVQELN